jgi:hypothetical protein
VLLAGRHLSGAPRPASEQGEQDLRLLPQQNSLGDLHVGLGEPNAELWLYIVRGG